MLMADDVRTVAVIGSGTVGPGVALAYAMAGFVVWLADIKVEAIERARTSIDAACRLLAEEEYLSAADAEQAIGRIRPTTDVDAAVRTADFVQEAIPEDVQLKQQLYRHLETVARPDVWLGTNTSTFQIADITAAMHEPERVVGVHWVAPPYLIPAVEILRGETTPQAAVDFGVALMKRANKVPLVVRDVPGFIFNRLQHVLGTAALELVEEGGVSFEDVDNAMRYGMAIRYPLWGIFGTQDRVIHKRTAIQAAAYLSQATGNPKYGPHRLLVEAAEDGRYGIVTGKGWYDYPDRDPAELARDRDRQLVRMVKLLRNNEVL
jgi:3-hydroxyacyl-CoA dehydrogenase